MQSQGTQPAMGGIGSFIAAPPKGMVGLNSQFNNKMARDSLNITNSLIISNSQILFQDMGNGKIVPVPMQFNQLNQMGIQQSEAGNQTLNSTIDHQGRRDASLSIDRGSHFSGSISQTQNAKSRQARRKTAQSTRFNTIAPQNSVPQDYINLDKSMEPNPQELFLQQQHTQGSTNSNFMPQGSIPRHPAAQMQT